MLVIHFVFQALFFETQLYFFQSVIQALFLNFDSHLLVFELLILNLRYLFQVLRIIYLFVFGITNYSINHLFLHQPLHYHLLHFLYPIQLYVNLLQNHHYQAQYLGLNLIYLFLVFVRYLYLFFWCWFDFKSLIFCSWSSIFSDTFCNSISFFKLHFLRSWNLFNNIF